MNLTLSVDDELVEKARQVASRQGTSLQALVRQYIETLAGSPEGAALVEQLEAHWHEADKHLKQHPARSYKLNRGELYDDRIGRKGRGE
jgi:hypothetical protein